MIGGDLHGLDRGRDGMLAQVRSEMADLAAMLPRIESELEVAREPLRKAEVIRRHVLKNPEKFSPDERENVFRQAQSLGERAIEQETVLQATRERLELLIAVEPYLGQESESAAAPARHGASALEIQDAIDMERARLARELHDGPAQMLSDLVLEADILARLLKRDPGLVEAELEEFKEAVRTAVADMRRVMFNLRPLSMDDLGLVSALTPFAEEFKDRTGIVCRLEVQGDGSRPPGAVEDALYRIIQEALTNVARHSQANAAQLRLRLDAGRVELDIEDDGVGFDLLQAEAGFGLAVMRERASSVGASVDLKSTPGAGTRISVELILAETGVLAVPGVRKDQPPQPL